MVVRRGSRSRACWFHEPMGDNPGFRLQKTGAIALRLKRLGANPQQVALKFNADEHKKGTQIIDSAPPDRAAYCFRNSGPFTVGLLVGLKSFGLFVRRPTVLRQTCDAVE